MINSNSICQTSGSICVPSILTKANANLHTQLDNYHQMTLRKKKSNSYLATPRDNRWILILRKDLLLNPIAVQGIAMNHHLLKLFARTSAVNRNSRLTKLKIDHDFFYTVVLKGLFLVP